jgi:transposase, IS6 family
VSRARPAPFRGRHFADVIIILCVRWYLRYSLSYRDLEEIIAERGLAVDHVTIWRWVQHYSPLLNQRLRHALRRPNESMANCQIGLRAVVCEVLIPLPGCAISLSYSFI